MYWGGLPGANEARSAAAAAARTITERCGRRTPDAHREPRLEEKAHGPRDPWACQYQRDTDTNHLMNDGREVGRIVGPWRRNGFGTGSGLGGAPGPGGIPGIMPGGIAPGGSMIGPPGGGAYIAGEARFSRSMLPRRTIARIDPAALGFGHRIIARGEPRRDEFLGPRDRREVLVVAIGQVDHLDHEVPRNGLVEVLVGEAQGHCGVRRKVRVFGFAGDTSSVG